MLTRVRFHPIAFCYPDKSALESIVLSPHRSLAMLSSRQEQQSLLSVRDPGRSYVSVGTRIGIGVGAFIFVVLCVGFVIVRSKRDGNSGRLGKEKI